MQRHRAPFVPISCSVAHEAGNVWLPVCRIARIFRMAGASSSHRPRVIEKRVVSLEEKCFWAGVHHVTLKSNRKSKAHSPAANQSNWLQSLVAPFLGASGFICHMRVSTTHWFGQEKTKQIRRKTEPPPPNDIWTSTHAGRGNLRH